MSDSEWGIIRDAIPDPESATIGQLLAGLDEFKKRLEDRAGMTSDQPEVPTPGLSKAQSSRLQELREKREKGDL